MIAPHQLEQILAQDPTTPVVDVRTPLEFREVHLASAMNHPLDTLSELPGLAKDRPVYLICRTGTRASLAAQKLQAVGFAQPIVVQGGTQGWIEAGLPVERGEVQQISLERQVRIAAGALVLSGVLLGFFVHVGFYGLAGFVGAGLIFAGVTDWCGMGLLLAKVPWNR